jgi:hypothetical protein
MTANGVITSAAHATGRIAPRRVEKTRGSNALHGEERRHDEAASERRSTTVDRRMSRNGTDRRTPLWDGPRWRAPFVAQVLGQLLQTGDEDHTRSALAAYDERAATPSLLFNLRT